MRIHRAYAKINWSLGVKGLRADGYHLLDMVMQQVALHDTLTFEGADGISLAVAGGVEVSSGEDNLILRAARLLQAEAGAGGRGARIVLTKRIPMGAGLGGGSADAAATLLALSALWETRLDAEALLTLGARLGADVPFCLRGGMARVGGIGEEIEPFQPGRRFDLVIVKPERGLSTPAVFRAYDSLTGGARPVDMDAVQDALAQGDVERLGRVMGNDLQAAAVSMLPEIAQCVDALEALGAKGAMMTGSGSAVFGLFAGPQEAQAAARACAARWPFAVATHGIG